MINSCMFKSPQQFDFFIAFSNARFNVEYKLFRPRTGREQVDRKLQLCDLLHDLLCRRIELKLISFRRPFR